MKRRRKDVVGCECHFFEELHKFTHVQGPRVELRCGIVGACVRLRTFELGHPLADLPFPFADGRFLAVYVLRGRRRF